MTHRNLFEHQPEDISNLSMYEVQGGKSRIGDILKMLEFFKSEITSLGEEYRGYFDNSDYKDIDINFQEQAHNNFYEKVKEDFLFHREKIQEIQDSVKDCARMMDEQLKPIIDDIEIGFNQIKINMQPYNVIENCIGNDNGDDDDDDETSTALVEVINHLQEKKRRISTKIIIN